MENLVMQLAQLGLFSAFIHALVEVVKGISARGVFGIVKDVVLSFFRNETLTPEVIRSIVFALALFYCWGFDFGVMSRILGVEIPDSNALAWWLDYIGTSSVVYVGVEVFYGWVKKMKAGLTSNGG
jgi:hypothetical protein